MQQPHRVRLRVLVAVRNQRDRAYAPVAYYNKTGNTCIQPQPIHRKKQVWQTVGDQGRMALNLSSFIVNNLQLLMCDLMPQSHLTRQRYFKFKRVLALCSTCHPSVRIFTCMLDLYSRATFADNGNSQIIQEHQKIGQMHLARKPWMLTLTYGYQG